MNVRYSLLINNKWGCKNYSPTVVSQYAYSYNYAELQLLNRSVIKQFLNWFGLFGCSLIMIVSCTVSKQIYKQANTILLKDSVINTGHIGISIYEPATDKYWFNYDATKYFVPASNVKLFTLYAGLKYMGDSLPGLKYQQKNNELHIYPTGDPTFLHPDFKQQSVFNFLKNKSNIFYHSKNYTNALGKGWAWDDYLDYYMVQRSEFPIYGNLIQVNVDSNIITTIPKNINLNVSNSIQQNQHSLSRKWDNNNLTFYTSLLPKKNNYQVPLFVYLPEIINFLGDTIKQKINFIGGNEFEIIKKNDSRLTTIYSQPTDSLFKPMLHNSDNFFAEQTLLMASDTRLGYMNEAALIDTLLDNDFKDIPQKPRWVDGSGLSRYNLFSPESLVYILNKLQKEFGIKRLKTILPTGGEGTFKNYYQKDSGYIFAKTGSLSNHTAISGYLYSQKGKLLIFSVIVNQFQGSTAQVRHAVESFLEGIRAKY